MSPPERIDRRVDAIVIGTSAGGVEALSVLLPALPAHLQASVYIVLHLPSEPASLLAAIFGPKCLLPVREARDKEEPQPGTVYFAPPDYHLLLEHGPYLALSVDAAVHFSRPSIDVLFESAAEVYRERLLGIILTGANDDGAAGLEAVQRAGGMTMVQRPDSAQVPFMVLSALKRSQPDFVLPLEQIGAVLHSLGAAVAAPPRVLLKG
ncbi:MAG: chemotaxis protein CheB [Steroidobacteraceae bacterium]